MGRPDNWQGVIAEHGWGTAPERLRAKLRTDPETGCELWTGKLRKDCNVPQIRVWVNGHGWLESAARLAWMLRHHTVPTALHIKRTCCNRLCVSHLSAVEPNTIASVCEYRKMREGVFSAAKKRRKLSDRQAKWVREYHRRGWDPERIASHYGVSRSTIYHLLSGHTYRSSTWEPAPPRRSATTRQEEDAIYDGYVGGATMAQLAEENERHINTIRNIIRRTGERRGDADVIRRGGKEPIPEWKRIMIQRMRSERMTYREIMETLGVSSTSIVRIIREAA